jgi:Arc/MetJ-type ribon-helix-helix transcriptional regulator
MSGTQNLEQFVEQQLAAGYFENYEQMVAEGLSLLWEREQHYDQLADELRPAVERFESGHPSVEVDIEEIKALGRKYLAQHGSD